MPRKRPTAQLICQRQITLLHESQELLRKRLKSGVLTVEQEDKVMALINTMSSKVAAIQDSVRKTEKEVIKSVKQYSNEQKRELALTFVTKELSPEHQRAFYLEIRRIVWHQDHAACESFSREMLKRS